MTKQGEVCILSGLEIPKGKQNREHLCPKSRVPRFIWDNPANIFPAHKVVNSIKANLMPCEFEEVKYSLTYHALQAWKIKPDDREFLQRTLQNWEHNYHPNYCDICLIQCKQRTK